MRDTNRKIPELWADYAAALRDGCIPMLLRSLTRQEAQRIACSLSFWDGIETVQVLNSVAFADKAVIPNVNLFISRVDAKIACRSKRAAALSSGRCTLRREQLNKTDKAKTVLRGN